MGLCRGAALGEAPGAGTQRPPPFPPPRAEFRAEVVQKKREALLCAEDTAALAEEHRHLMAWNAAENARQRARRSGSASPGCWGGTTALHGSGFSFRRTELDTGAG